MMIYFENFLKVLFCITIFFIILSLVLFILKDFIEDRKIRDKYGPSLHSYHMESLVKRSMTMPLEKIFLMTAKQGVDEICKNLNMKIEYHNVDSIKNIIGPVVVISNENSNIDGSFVVDLLSRESAKDVKLLRLFFNSIDNITNNTYSMPLVKFINDNQNKLVYGAKEDINKFLSSNNMLLIFPSAKFDVRLFDLSDYYKFKSGFLRFAKDNNASILPVYIDIKLPYWLLIIKSILPSFAEMIQNSFFVDLYKNKTMRIIVGDIIPSEKVQQDNINQNTQKYDRRTLDKYEKILFSLKNSV